MIKTVLNYLVIVFIAFKSIAGEVSVVLEYKSDLEKLNYTMNEFLGNVFRKDVTRIEYVDDSFSTMDKLVTNVDVLEKLDKPHEVILLANKLDTGNYLNSQVTAYCMGQVTSTGKHVKEGYIAASRDLVKKLGYGKDVVLLQEHKDGEIDVYGKFVIEDTMASYIKNTFDVYMKRERDCLNFGRKKMKVVVLD